MTKEIQHIIYKNLENTASPEEKQKLETWLSESGYNQLLYDDIKQSWNSSIAPATFYDSKKGFERLNEKIDLSESFDYKSQFEFKEEKESGRFPLLKVAASITSILIVMALSVFFINNSIHKERGAKIIEVSTGVGERLSVILNDSSTIILNSSSTLNYPEYFSGKKREVFLKGEAFFEITPDKNKPFLVHTQSIITRVLGTSFSISSYQENEDVKVSVLTGKVAVSHNDKHLADLSRDMEITFNKTSRSFVTNTINVSELTSWKDGTLIFNEASIEEILVKLEKWYGVRIMLTGTALSGCSFTGKFKNVALTQVLDMLKISTPFEYEIKEKTVVISGKQCR